MTLVSRVFFLRFFFWKADGLILSSRAYSYYPEDSLQPQPPSGRRHSSRSPNVGNISFPEDSLQPQPPSGRRHSSRSPNVGNISFPEDSLQPQPPSGQRYSSRSPNVGNISFPEPHYDGSASHPPAYFPPSQTTPNLTVPTHHQHGRRGSHGHSPSGSYSDSQYSARTGSDTGSGSNFYSMQPGVRPHHGGGYPETAAEPRDLNPAGHEGAQGHGPWSLAPGSLPEGGHSKHTFDFVSFSGVSSGPV